MMTSVRGPAPRYNIGLVAWELTGAIQAGGVGDVNRDLAINLRARGHKTYCFLPDHANVKVEGRRDALGYDLWAMVGSERLHSKISRASLPGSGIPVFLIGSHEGLFNQKIYWNGEENVKRYIFASKIVPAAVRELQKGGELPPLDILHFHDSPFAFSPAYIRLTPGEGEYFRETALVGTIHNGGIGYQGEADLSLYSMTGLPAEMRYMLECDGEMRLIKGLSFCEMLNTVSCQYVRELQMPKFGRPLVEWYQLLAGRGQLIGIPNGVSGWDPKQDEGIVNLRSESDEDIIAYKAANKARLQEQVGLPVRPDVPLFSIVSRLAPQKFGLLMWQHDGMKTLLEHLIANTSMQMVVLSQAQKGVTAEEYYEKELKFLAERYRGRFAFVNRFAPEKEKRIYHCGADFFLMASEFEPCGLGQLYAMRYGTPPAVVPVGGLFDTVTRERGFVAKGPFTGDVAEIAKEAVATFDNKPWLLQMTKADLAYDSSWGPSMEKYEAMYARASELKRQRADF
ncbi:MAG: glycogen/starch synthase [Candidatus Saganbacteria bacterium]|nr:glycogen/starch synthase [Candidatus Saganbacteria bacterium]